MNIPVHSRKLNVINVSKMDAVDADKVFCRRRHTREKKARIAIQLPKILNLEENIEIKFFREEGSTKLSANIFKIPLFREQEAKSCPQIFSKSEYVF